MLNTDRYGTLFFLIAGVSLNLCACTDASELTAVETQSSDTASGNNLALQYPEDFDLDDREGLIVTGLDNQDPDAVSAPWFMHSNVFRRASGTPGTGDGFVSLVQLDSPILVSQVIRFYEQPLDTCSVGDQTATPETQAGSAKDMLPLISGGGALSINTPVGSWFRFLRSQHASGDFLYATDNHLPGEIPDGATLFIPGDAFPTMAAYPLFEPADPVRLLPDPADGITKDSLYAWVPDGGNDYMKINFLAYDDRNEFQGFMASCYLIDDGAFSMPENLREFVSASPHRLEARYSRVYNRVDYIDGVIAFQSAEVAE